MKVNANGEDDGAIIKVKGIRLAYDTKDKINYQTMKLTVIDFCSPEPQYPCETIDFQQIQRKKNMSLVTAAASKLYRLVYEKRLVAAKGTKIGRKKVSDGYHTLPWGFSL